MADSRKKQVQQLASEIRQRRTDPAVGKITRLIDLLVEDAKDNLIVSAGDQTLQLQGEAQALNRLLVMLTREPPSIKREGDQ